MGWKRQLTTGLGLLLAAGTGVAGNDEGNRGLSPIIAIISLPIITTAIGICQIVDNTPGWPAGEVRIPNTIEADQSVIEYIYRTAHIDLSNAARTVTRVKAPQYGSLKPVDGMLNGYEYLPPSSTYTGKDSTTFLVQIGGYKVRVMYMFHVLISGVGDRPEDIKAICGPKGTMWRISNR